MTRDELIEAVIPALGLSYVRHPGYAQGRARRVLDAVEPLIRAEYEGEREAWEETMRRYVNGVLADLRAKVEALPTTSVYINRDQVLELLDGPRDAAVTG